MQDGITQLNIDDIADLPGTHSLFGLGESDTLDISLVDIVIAAILHD
jgi:hypothetical protein